ncbi:MAG: hypothetical protein HQL32_13950, partial [Planctomycetes bacterium]|nr:hypothetical protein [Planctomycetota bacterium]
KGTIWYKNSDLGVSPMLMQPVRAKVTIKTTVPTLKVKAINASGKVVQKIPTEYSNGELSFHIGQHQTMYYLISK